MILYDPNKDAEWDRRNGGKVGYNYQIYRSSPANHLWTSSSDSLGLSYGTYA